ncbi:MurR/RpiR family transcriptional regulator [Mesoplasma photuris]|uniref:MurR/RpiR family transcriptional regulator n=1 Tax=Mesoplasma photuris TaxID=217731 RepID=UPI0004E0F709|nr:MurR/RpiR family transcriptional regulator [Mesoplasma photuris]
MVSIVKILCKFLENDEKETFYIISKKILEHYNEGEFLSQSELANECFVSQPLITQFCKSINFSGYRELIIRLKIEYENIIYLNKMNLNNLNETLSDLITLHEFINNNIKILNELINSILNNEKIAFISSGQSNYSMQFFINSINIKGFTNVVFFNSQSLGRSSRYVDSLFKFNKYFFTFTGVLSPLEKRFYNECLENVDHSKIFTLITEGKQIKVIEGNNINLNLDVKYSDTIYRNLLFDILFLEIINKLNKELITL